MHDRLAAGERDRGRRRAVAIARRLRKRVRPRGHPLLAVVRARPGIAAQVDFGQDVVRRVVGEIPRGGLGANLGVGHLGEVASATVGKAPFAVQRIGDGCHAAVRVIGELEHLTAGVGDRGDSAVAIATDGNRVLVAISDVREQACRRETELDAVLRGQGPRLVLVANKIQVHAHGRREGPAGFGECVVAAVAGVNDGAGALGVVEFPFVRVGPGITERAVPAVAQGAVAERESDAGCAATAPAHDGELEEPVAGVRVDARRAWTRSSARAGSGACAAFARRTAANAGATTRTAARATSGAPAFATAFTASASAATHLEGNFQPGKPVGGIFDDVRLTYPEEVIERALSPSPGTVHGVSLGVRALHHPGRAVRERTHHADSLGDFLTQ